MVLKRARKPVQNTLTHSAPLRALAHLLRLCCAVALLTMWLHSAAQAATLPAGFTETQVSGGLSNPTAMALAPDGRIFVCQQGGQLRVIKNGTLLATPFLSVTVDSAGERGLLGIAFDPNFSTNNFLYIYYTATTPAIHNRVSRFTANGDLALAGSETVLLDLDNLSGATNHNGGAMHFGPDGKLYIAVGENATPSNSQTLGNLLGKILRINADGTIPTDNPFFGTATGKNRAIWALGLRNPYTFAFQPGTGRMFINDVGQNAWEEINDGIAGSNYGWPTCEGSCSNQSFRNPLFFYGHGTSSTTGCAITGGAFYNPAVTQFPSDYIGKYFFADFCSGWIRRMNPSDNTATDFATGINSPVDLLVAPDGSLYYLARGSGAIFRVQATTPQTPPIITQHPASQTVQEGQTATFSVTATGSAPLNYQWQKNNVDIPGANSSSYTTPPVTTAENGAQFRLVVSNAGGSATSNNATLTVNPLPLTVQFSQSSYSVSEGALFLNITVNRGGNSTAAATVKYSTSDATDVNFRCDPATAGQPTGIASRKCDYHIAAGTLRFAAGETTKQFTLSIVNDVYVEAPESFTITLSNPVGVTLGTNSSVPVKINDDGDTAGQANPIGGTAFFVRQLYVDLLSREPDGSSPGWVTRIDQCGQPGQAPPPCDRVTVAGDGFLGSTEFFDRQFFVIRLYRTGLGRIPIYPEVGDLASVSGFLTAQQLELNKQDLVAELMARTEFSNRYSGLDNSGFVNLLLSTAGVSVPDDVRQAWVTALGGGTKTRAQVFREISERGEVTAKYLNEARVISCYYGFFTRNPDAAYFDFLDRLNRGEITLGDLANAFVNAAEYRQRFGP